MTSILKDWIIKHEGEVAGLEVLTIDASYDLTFYDFELGLVTQHITIEDAHVVLRNGELTGVDADAKKLLHYHSEALTAAVNS